MYVRNGKLFGFPYGSFEMGNNVVVTAYYPNRYSTLGGWRNRLRWLNKLPNPIKGMVVGFRYINIEWRIGGGLNEEDPAYVEKIYIKELVILVCVNPMKKPIYVPVKYLKKVKNG